MTSEKEKNDGGADREAPAIRRTSEVGATTRFDLETLRAALNRDEERRPAFTVIAGAQLGLTVPVTDGMVIGRGRECDVVLSGRGISRRHLRFDREGAENYVVVDLDSTNGVLINGQRERRHLLAHGDRLNLGPATVLKFSVEDTTEISIRVRQYEDSIRDDLTGIHNRRHFATVLAHEVAYARRHGEPLSLLIFDLDHFKQINDRFGHAAGDEVIRGVAGEVGEHLRAEDFFARYGGEEFVIILRGQEGRAAHETGERLRALIEGLRFDVGETEVSLTTSVGIASLGGASLDPATLTRLADRCLYAAKAAGRNRVVSELPPA